MKLWEVFRFELAYQVRRPWVWLSMAVLAVFAFVSTRVAIVPVTLPQDFILNSPFIIAAVSVFSCQIWLLLAPAVAGEAAARDVHTGMYPLTSTSPVSKAEYLGGRFLAAFVLQALILLAVQVGCLLAVYAPGANPEIIGPFRPAAYLAAYAFIGLTNAFIATTFQFSVALLSGRPIASYVGSMGLFFLSYPVTFTLYLSGLGERALLADPIGVMAIMNEMMSKWTLVEKNVRMFTLEGPMLWNRLLWLGISLVTIAFIYRRYRFAHRTETGLLSRLTRRFARTAPTPPTPETAPARIAISVPQVRQSFGFAAHWRQTLAIARSSFWMIAKSPAGLFLLVVFPMFLVLVLRVESEHWGIPLLPRTGYLLTKHLTSPLTQAVDFRVIIPLLIVYFAGELVWRERDAGSVKTSTRPRRPSGSCSAGSSWD
jgi:ABC-2 type transport system permease protein